MKSPRILVLPGWQNSGPLHWQSLWEAHYGYERVEQHDWMRPLRGDWIARLEEVLVERAAARRQPGAQDGPGIMLAAHSLGCILVAAWAAHSRNAALVKGALLVAPGDPQREEFGAALSSWSPVVLQALPFRSLLLASSNDPYCSFTRAQVFAKSWGAEFVDYGQSGHINVGAGLRLWPDRHRFLMGLCEENT